VPLVPLSRHPLTLEAGNGVSGSWNSLQSENEVGLVLAHSPHKPKSGLYGPPAVVQQLGEISGAAEKFIIIGSASSVLSGVGAAVAEDIAEGAFGTSFYNNKGFLNSGPLNLGGSFDKANQTLYFSLHSDWFHLDLFEWWP